MPYPILDLGGDGPPLHLAIANGFPPETYRPLLEPLAGRYRIVSLLPRPLWPAPPPPGEMRSWRTLVDDLLAGLREHNLTDVVAVGHSMGGVFSLLAALAEPERFRALVLLDPTILPPHLLAAIRVARALGLEARLPLVQGALKRRARFADVGEAFAYWHAKPLFRGWPEETVRLYARSMTRPAPSGGVELAYPPEWEARIYQTIPTDLWREVRLLSGPARLPVLVVRGAETNTFVAASARRFMRLVPGAACEVIEGHGHFFPHTAPGQTRRILEAWLAENG